MLISRIAASVIQDEEIPQSDLKPVNQRVGSLSNLWLSKQRGIQEAFQRGEFNPEFECVLLSPSEYGRAKSTAIILEGGQLQFYIKARGPYNSISVMLRNSIVVAHLRTCLIQVSTDSQILVFSVPDLVFENVCASLFSWSQLRTAGIAAKYWIPPSPRPESTGSSYLLEGKISAQFTNYHSDNPEWAPYDASLSMDGQLVLRNGEDVVYKVSVGTMRNTQIKMMHPSVVGSSTILMLFPDYGGPNTVYLLLDNSTDYATWVATLKALSQQEVAAPLVRDPAQCIRWYDTLLVKIGSCENESDVDEQNEDGTTRRESLANTYVEICLRCWAFGRTIENIDKEAANWGQTFDISDPEFDQSGFSTVELKLRRIQYHPEIIGMQEGVTLGSIELTQWDSNKGWQWLHVTGTPFKINIDVQPTRISVLDACYYQELARKFENIDLQAPARILNAYPSLMTKLFPIFTKMYLAQGDHLEWVLNLATQEIDKMNFDSDVLFRGTSLFTKSMEFLLQQHGGVILENTVGRFIRKLKKNVEAASMTTGDSGLELDPSRISGNANVERAQINMQYYLHYLWTLIRNEGVPPQAKTVFRHMESLLSKRGLPEEKISKVMNRTLSAFLFLRFYVPALINPQLYDLVSQNVEKSFRRTLVLVAKILQGFANRVRFGSKEIWLVPMNKFIDENEPDLVTWYLNIYNGNGAVNTSQSGGIRRVNNLSLEIEEPGPKQISLNTFMSQTLTIPDLIDKWAIYSQLVNVINTDCAPDTSKADDPLVQEIIQDSGDIAQKEREITGFLEEPDMYEDSCAGPPPALCFNKESYLLGLSPDDLEFEPEISKSSSFSESITKMSWLSKPRSLDSDNSLDEVKSKTGSVKKKLMAKFGLSR